MGASSCSLGVAMLTMSWQYCAAFCVVLVSNGSVGMSVSIR